MRTLAVLALACTVSCKRKQEAEPAPVPVTVNEKPAAVVEPSKPEPTAPDPGLDAPRKAPVPTPPRQQPFEIDKLKSPSDAVTVEALLDDVRAVGAATAPELVVVKIVGSYVTKSGELDARYGRLDLELQIMDSADGIVDDPNRPTGAPITDVAPAEATRERCPRMQFSDHVWAVAGTRCTKLKQLKPGPSCTVAQIWSKAIADGAPDHAVAIVQFDARLGFWQFRIGDKLRGVNIDRTYADDCKEAPAKSKPAGAKPNPFTVR